MDVYRNECGGSGYLKRLMFALLEVLRNISCAALTFAD